VIIDCVDRECSVEELLEHSEMSATGTHVHVSGSETRKRSICSQTPCWIDLDYGPHKFDFSINGMPWCADEPYLYFEGTGDCAVGASATVTSTLNPTVIRVRPGFERHAPSKSRREVHAPKVVTFEVTDGRYGAPQQ